VLLSLEVVNNYANTIVELEAPPKRDRK